MEISEVLDGRRFTLDQLCALRIEQDGQIITLDPHTTAMMKLFIRRQDVSTQIEWWLICYEEGGLQN